MTSESESPTRAGSSSAKSFSSDAATLDDTADAIESHTTTVTVEQIPIESINRSFAPSATASGDGSDLRLSEPGHRTTGLRIIRYLLISAGAVLVFISIVAYNTWPTLSDVNALGIPEADVASEYAKLRNDWFQMVKDLMQVYLVATLLPLISSVIGYTLGQRSSE